MRRILFVTIVLMSVVCATRSFAETKEDDLFSFFDFLVERGETFCVKLPANPSTGYSWYECGSSPIGIRFLSDKFVQSNTDKNLVGAPGLIFRKYKAEETGKFHFVLKYIRIWEKDIPPIKYAVVTVDVR